MIRSWFCAVLAAVGLFCLSSGWRHSSAAAAANDDGPTPAKDVALSEETRWLAPSPLADRDSSHKVRLIYFVPQGREPRAHYAGKIRALMTLVSDVIRRDLIGAGSTASLLDFEHEAAKADGSPGDVVVHFVQGKRPFEHYNGGETYDRQTQWQTVNVEVEAVLGAPKQRIHMIFADTHGLGPATVEWPGAHAHAAWLSADAGVAIMTAWILHDELCGTTPEEELKLLFDATPIEGRTALGHGKLNSPRCEFIEDGVGAVVHELGHALGLAHDQRDPRNIMGNGFRDLRRSFDKRLADADRPSYLADNHRILALSRFLNTQVDRTDDKVPKFDVSFSKPPRAGDEAVNFHLKTEDDRALGAIVYRDLAADTVNGSQMLEGKGVTIDGQFRPGKLVEGQKISFGASLIDRGGNMANAALDAIVLPAEGAK